MTLTRFASAAVALAAALSPLVAQAQQVNPYKPMVTSPPGPQNPALLNPSNPGMPGSTSGVIVPRSQMSNMPVIRPTVPSNMPVIVPPDTMGGKTVVVPK